MRVPELWLVSPSSLPHSYAQHGVRYDLPYGDLALHGFRDDDASSTTVFSRRRSAIADPTRGVRPDDILAGSVPIGAQAIYILSHDIKLPYAWQSAVGVQKQVGQASSIDADPIYVRGGHEVGARDANLFYDPKILFESKGKSDSLLLATSFKRRFFDNFQANVNCSLMFFMNDNTDGAYY